MGVEASAVQISINVVENSGPVVKNVETNFDRLGEAGTRSGQRMRKGLEEVEVGGRSAMHNMHLFEEEVGIRLPKAFTRLAAESKAAQAILGALGGVMMGFGAIQIGFMVGEQIYEGVKKVYEKWIDVDGAIEKYNNEAAKAAAQKFDENRSAYRLSEDLREASKQLDGLNAKRQNSPKWWMYLGAGGSGNAAPGQISNPMFDHPYFSTGDANKMNAAQKAADLDKMASAERQHKAILQAIDDTKALAEAHARTPMGRAAADRSAADARAEEERKYSLATQRHLAEISARAGKKPGEEGYVPQPTNKDYVSEQENAYHQADVAYQTKQIESARETENELRRLHEEAIEASLSGYALLEQKRKHEDDEFVRTHGRNTQTLADIDRRSEAEKTKLHQTTEREVQHTRAQSQVAGFTGADRIQAEGTSRVNEFYAQDHPGMDPGQRLAMLRAMTTETQQAIAREQQSFAQRVDAIVAESADRTVSAYGRIHAEAQKKIDEFDTQAKTSHAKPADRVRGETAIRADEAAQIKEMTRTTEEETEQIEMEARSRSMNAERNRTVAIDDEYRLRFEKYEDWKRKELSSDKLTADERLAIEQQAGRREAAAWQQRNAEMEESARAAREKMAGEYTRLFHSLDHPAEALKDAGDRVAGQAAAALTQRLQQRWQGTHGGSTLETSDQRGGMFGGLFDRIAGVPGHKSSVGAPSDATAHGSYGPAGKTIALSTAQIYVQSANFGFAGMGAASTGAGSMGRAAMPFNLSSVTAPGSIAGSSSDTNPATGVPLSMGGSGSSTSGMGAGSSFSEAGTTAPGGGSSITGTALSTASQGMALYNSFHGQNAGSGTAGQGVAETQSADLGLLSNGSKNLDFGTWGQSTKNNGMLGGGGFKNNAAGAAGGAVGLYSAYESNGGIGGAASGAMSGMKFGASVAGPMGAAVGAVAGAVLGAFGFGGREKARVYDLKQVRPHIAETEQSYEAGQTDYLSAYSDMQSLETDAYKTIKSYGPSAMSYYNDTIKKELQQAEGKFTSMEKSGRGQYGMSAAQFDQGGWTGDFGSMATSSNTGWAHMRSNEFVVHEQPAATHAGALEAIRSGASHEDMARYYGASESKATASPAWGGDVHLHVRAIDSRDVERFFDENMHVIRSKVNKSMAENSGGADAGY
ncbi:MAG: hypothetical protein P4K83_02080 [Terracidiphilus sp.]|nr:hypothetical protein [Terracidiphilus sp.]